MARLAGEIRAELEEVRSEIEHLYRVRADALDAELTREQDTRYRSLLYREQQLLADLATIGRTAALIPLEP